MKILRSAAPAALLLLPALSWAQHAVEEEDLEPGQPRLLATDNALVLPVGTTIRVLVTASDPSAFFTSQAQPEPN